MRDKTRLLWVLALIAAVVAAALAAGLWSVDRRLARAEARAGIEQAISEITFAQDRHDGRAFAAHFLPTGTVRITNTERPRIARGPAELQGFASGPGSGARLPFSGAPGDIHHVVTNHAIVFRDDDHAVHRAYYVSMARDRAGRGLVFVEMGSFEDSMVRRDGRWLIADHHIVHHGTVPGAS